MNDYWKQQFLDDCAASETEFRKSYRKITSDADNRMRERTAKEQQKAAMDAMNRGPDEVIDDADDSAIQRGMLT